MLLVDDESQALAANEFALLSGGISNIVCMMDSRDVMPFLREESASVMILDLTMPHISGEELLAEVSESCPETMVAVLTGDNEIETAVRCIKAGAFDYLVKPVEPGRLLAVVNRALELRELRWECSSLRRRFFSQDVEHPDAFAEIITGSPAMFSIFRYIESVAGTSQPILVTGETGVGKELIARAIHRLSGRKGHFVAVNVAGLEDGVFSDTLFGHLKGAFTGAEEARAGLVETASGGTLLLDEIGELNRASQVKLLRLLQEREYYPIGADYPKTTDVRIIASTNKDIDSIAREQTLRNDLYFRLRTHHIHIPPLRERRQDVILLIDHYLEEAARELGRDSLAGDDELYEALRLYDFPGNVRELKALIYDAVSKADSGLVTVRAIAKHLKLHAPSRLAGARSATEDRLLLSRSGRLPTLEEVTDLLVAEALRRTEGNQTRAARLLGISQSTLSRRLQRAPRERR